MEGAPDMRAPRRSAQEQLEMIQECRASGLTIADWCRREGIAPDTYHTWVNRLKEKGLLESAAVVSRPIYRDPFAPDIVKVEVAAPTAQIPERSFSTSLSCARNETEKHESSVQLETVMEVSFGGIRIKVTNQINPQLLAETIRLLGGDAAC